VCWKWTILVVLAGSVTVVASATPAVAQSPPDLKLKAAVVAAGGGRTDSAQLVAWSTIGQPTAPLFTTVSGVRHYPGLWGAIHDVVHPTAVESLVPLRTRLGQNFPNPFNPLTTIPYALAAAGPVEITIYNIRGERIRTLVRGILPRGDYRAPWDGCDDAGRTTASGLYVYRLEAGSQLFVRKMLLLR